MIPKFASLILKIPEELQSIHIKLSSLIQSHQKQEEAVRSREKTAHEYNPPNALMLRVQDLIKRVRDENRKSYEKQKVLQWATFWITSVGAIVLTIYTAFTAALWIEGKRSSNAAESAANNASINLAQTQVAFRLEQRPYLVVSGVPEFASTSVKADKSVSLSVNVTFKNIGKTPAIKIVDRAKLIPFRPLKIGAAGRKKFLKFIMSAFFELREEESNARKEMADLPAETEAGSDTAPEGTFFTSNKEPAVLSQEEFRLLQKETGEFLIYCVGTATYTDTYQGIYRTDFCYFYFGSDLKTWHVCDSHNAIR